VSKGYPANHALLADVNLELHIVWSGAVRASWQAASARAERKREDTETVSSVTADEYKLTLKRLGGKNPNEHEVEHLKTIFCTKIHI